MGEKLLQRLLSSNRLFIYLFFFPTEATCWDVHTRRRADVLCGVHGILFLLFFRSVLDSWAQLNPKKKSRFSHLRCCCFSRLFSSRKGNNEKSPPVCRLLNIDFSHFSLALAPAESFPEFRSDFHTFPLSMRGHSFPAPRDVTMRLSRCVHTLDADFYATPTWSSVSRTNPSWQLENKKRIWLWRNENHPELRRP